MIRVVRVFILHDSRQTGRGRKLGWEQKQALGRKASGSRAKVRFNVTDGPVSSVPLPLSPWPRERGCSQGERAPEQGWGKLEAWDQLCFELAESLRTSGFLCLFPHL